MESIAKLKKRFSLDKNAATIFGLVVVAVVLIFMFKSLQAHNYSYFVAYALALAVGVLFFCSKNHAENTLICYAAYSVYNLVCVLYELIKAGESISFSIQIPVSVAYAVFILMALYKPINDKLIKTVSLLFIVYMAVEGVYTIVTNGAEDSLIRELMASFNYFKYVSYLSGIMVGLTFFLAKYEDAESGAFYSVETKTGVTMASTLGFIHFVLFWTAVTLLNGHQYGLPDKYGSYRRGMYAWETNSADSISSLLWVPIALLCAIAVVHIKTEKYNESQKENGDETPVSTPAIMTFMVAGVLLIGTIFVYYRRSLYN